MNLAPDDLLSIEPADNRVQRLVYALCKDCKITFVEPEEKIIVQGYRDTEGMYLINDGFCRVHVCDKNTASGKMQDETIRVLEKGDYFGEVSLIYDLRRTASVTSQNYCTLGKLSLKTLHSILSNFPHFRKSLI